MCFRQCWLQTKLVVGVRHPGRWFESYHNFWAQVNKDHLPGPVEDLVGDKLLDQVKFHEHLSRLGTTTMSDPREREVLVARAAALQRRPPRMENKVFLYDVSQPFDPREGWDERYRRDLQEFLELTKALSAIHGIQTTDNPHFHCAIDICEDKYEALRAELVEVGTKAAAWKTEYFLAPPDVTVSSPERFKEIPKSWSADPCDE